MLDLVITNVYTAAQLMRTKKKQIRYVVSIGEQDDRQKIQHEFGQLTCPRLRLEFADWDSPELARRNRDLHGGPKIQDIERLVQFGERINFQAAGMFLIHCYAGQSRSTAAAYVLYALHLGLGNEMDALRMVYRARSVADPNRWVISLASKYMGRDLTTPLNEWTRDWERGAVLV